MKKIFKNKTFAYIIAGALMILQLASSIIKWSNGGFNGGSLILCLLMIGLLACIAIGINKDKNLLMLISGVAIISVKVYAVINDNSGALVKTIQDGTIDTSIIIWFTFLCLGVLFLLASLILAIIKAFGVKKDLRKLNAIFCILSVVCSLVPFIIPFVGGKIVTDRVPASIFTIVFPLLVACVGYQLEIKE